MDFLSHCALLFGYAIVGAISMSEAPAIIVKIWNALTRIDEWEKLKNGNMAVAVLDSAVSAQKRQGGIRDSLASSGARKSDASKSFAKNIRQ